MEQDLLERCTKVFDAAYNYAKVSVSQGRKPSFTYWAKVFKALHESFDSFRLSAFSFPVKEVLLTPVPTSRDGSYTTLYALVKESSYFNLGFIRSLEEELRISQSTPVDYSLSMLDWDKGEDSIGLEEYSFIQFMTGSLRHEQAQWRNIQEQTYLDDSTI